MSGSRRKPGPLRPFVNGYRAWLIGRGYSPSVVVRSLITLGHLGRWLERNALAVDQLTAEAVSSFLAEYRLRSLLRYLAVRDFADPRLARAVPRIAHWREATIPQFPTRPQIDRLLASCDRRDATGARDYAVLLLLARLGLRAVEVSRLRLDDLDWRAGQIIVDGKAHQRDQLPLPSDVGEAIVETRAKACLS